MALTPEEQTKRDSLIAKKAAARPQQVAPAQSSSGLSPAEQTRRTALLAKKQRATQSDTDIQRLINAASQKLPVIFEDPTGAPSPRFRRIRTEISDARSQLKALGKTDQQIDFAIQVQKKLNRPPIGRQVGAIAGTLAVGALIPGPADEVAMLASLARTGAGIAGAGVGGGIGEAAQTALDERRLISGREFLSAFGKEAAFEATGRGVVSGLKFAASPLIKQTVPEAAALIDDFAKVGGQFSPTELDKRFSLRVAEGFSRGSFGAAEIFQEFEEKQGAATIAFARNIIESIGEGVARETPEQIGETLASDITKPGGRIFNILDDLFNPLYDRLDDLTKSSIVKRTAQISVPSTILDSSGKPIERMVTRVIGERIKGTGVSTNSLKVFRKEIVAKNQRLVDVAKRTGKELPLVSPAGKTILEDIDKLPEVVGHSDYRAFRTKVLKETRKLNRDIDVSESMVKRISSITREELLSPKSVAGASPEAKRLHANINNLFSKSQQALKETLPESLAKRLLKTPSNVVKEVIKPNPKQVRLLRQSLEEPISGKPSAEGKILWNQIRQAWLAGAVEEATKEGVANPRLYNNILRKLGRETFNEMFPEKAVRESVDKIQTLFSVAGKRPPAGLSLFSRGAQTVGVVKVWQGAKAGDIIGITAGGVLSIGPLAFAKLATTPKGIKALTLGFKLKPGSSGLLPNAVRIIKILQAQAASEEGQRKAAERRKREQVRIGREPTLKQLRGFGGRGF